jgi:hypothetical protein
LYFSIQFLSSKQHFMKILLPAGIAVLLFTACGGKSEEKEYVSPTAATVPVTDTAAQQKEPAAIDQLLGKNITKAQPAPANEINMPQPVPAATAAQPVQAAMPATTAAGMNPPHGQPGHRCEIAVGAPLSTAPAAQPAVQPGAQPITVKQVQPTMVPAPAAPTAKGMNPPHGQPGHRCDIAVGAPLNSKPAAPAPQAIPAAQSQPVVQATPATAQQPAPAAPTAPGMNPPHGQPGHRCDIGVGAPLNSAPAKKDSLK